MQMSLLPLNFDLSPIFPVKSIEIRPHVHIMVSSGKFAHTQQRWSEATAPIFELSYSRKGVIHGEVNHQLVELKPGYSSLGFIDHASAHSEYQSGEEILLYSIWVQPEAFNSFCRAVGDTSARGFQTFQKGAYHFCSLKTDLREEGILSKLDSCLEKSADRLNTLMLESHILELLSLHFERLLELERTDEGFKELSKTDIERLNLAREILLHRIESPPSLLELSRLIQMNDCKLKRSFKVYFGHTVYEFVREQRLEKAFTLLSRQSCNVSQSAFAVGYTNISHFSKAFKGKFGISPGALIRSS